MSPIDFAAEHQDVIASVEQSDHEGDPVLKFVNHDGDSIAMKVPGGWEGFPNHVKALYEPMLKSLLPPVDWRAVGVAVAAGEMDRIAYRTDGSIAGLREIDEVA